MENMIRKTTEGVVLAVADKFGLILPSREINKDIMYQPDEIALKMRSMITPKSRVVGSSGKEEVSNKYSLDFINVWAKDMRFAWKRQRSALALVGLSTQYKNVAVNGKENIEMFKAVPVDIEYAISFWTSYKEKMDEFLQEFMFWQFEDPNINLFYDENKPLELDIIFDPSAAMDDSKIAKMFTEGKYWKHTVTITVESWLLRGVMVKTAKTIVLDGYFDVNYVANAETLFLHKVITENTPVPPEV
jgi:hypothetical protein